jgi:hypothetical protein
MAATTGRASNQTSANATRATTVHPAAEVSKNINISTVYDLIGYQSSSKNKLCFGLHGYEKSTKSWKNSPSLEKIAKSWKNSLNLGKIR